MEESRPGHHFIIQKDQPSDPDGLASLVVDYAEFLRRESEVIKQFPVPVEKILDHYGVDIQTRPIEGDRQGLKFSSAHLPYQVVFIEEEDKKTRRRFSVAHELVELLFEALHDGILSTRMEEACSGDRKERLCEKGAAELLMPEAAYRSYLKEHPVSFETGSRLADLFQVSFLSALIRMVNLAPRPSLLIAWREKLKPSQQKQKNPGQLTLPGMESAGPSEKLRVEWYRWTEESSHPYVPMNISVPTGSVIQRALEEGRRLSRTEHFSLGKPFSGKFNIGAMPLQIGEEKWVISLFDVS